MNPWQPMTNKNDVRVLGKALEELGELIQITSRCLIQGIKEREPASGKVNKLALEEEVADVLAQVGMLIGQFNLDQKFINKRQAEKLKKMDAWLKME